VLPAEQRLLDHRVRWDQKPVLRAIYEDFYARMRTHARPGRTLEVGGGPGHLGMQFGDVVATDLVVEPWLDLAADAQHLPFVSGSFDNVVLVDVLHHLAEPGAFFDESCRVLRDGGRVIMVEPAVTPVSYPIYKWLHPEPVLMRDDPYHLRSFGNGPKDPFGSNQAVPTLLFGRGRHEFERRYPRLAITECYRFSLWAYPLSGGFQSWNLVPSQFVDRMLRLERRIERLLGPIAGFRMLVVLTKGADTE